MNYYQKILIGIFCISLVGSPKAIATSAREYQIVQALSAQQINLRAKQVTVKIDGDNFGSGIIIAATDNTYTILTNWHVVKDSGNYIVQTVDGREHQVQAETIQRLSNIDLAIFQFTSQQNYQIAEIGNSDNLIEGQNIYFTGYPGELRTESDRFYRFFAANLVGLLDKPNANGYSLVYDGSAFPGMSGGPVFNNRGLLIGIHGSTNIHAVTGAVSNYAIPSNIYQAAIASINNDNSTSEAATSESENNNSSPSTATNQTETTTTKKTAATPETIVETNTSKQPVTDSDSTVMEASTTESETDNNSAAQSTNQSEAKTSEQAVAIPETIVETNNVQQPTTEINVSETNSVPVFNTPQNGQQNTQATAVNSASNDNVEQSEVTEETETTKDFPKITSESVVKISDEELNDLVDRDSIAHNPEDPNQSNSSRREVNLISPETGIDYSNLQSLLSQKQWLEADRQTKKAISNVFDTIKRKSQDGSLELRTISDRACNDLYTMDFLWRKYSGDRFGLRLQQDIWNNLNQNNNFSVTVWRNFATEIGWKEGDINNGDGYILYDELDFNPQTAPAGHLPWWFDYSNEQKDIMRQALTRCNLQDIVK